MFVPALTLGLGLSQLSAEATSLAAIVPVVAVGSFRQHRSGLVDWNSAGIIGACSLVGVLAGAEIALQRPRDGAAASVRRSSWCSSRCRWRCAPRGRCVRSRHERVRLDPARGVGRERPRDGARALARRRRLRRAAGALDGRARALLGRGRARSRDPVRDAVRARARRLGRAGMGALVRRRTAQPRQRVRRALGGRPGARRRRGDRLRGRGGRARARSPTRSWRARSRAAPRAWRSSACAAATRSHCSCRWRPRS